MSGQTSDDERGATSDTTDSTKQWNSDARMEENKLTAVMALSR